MAQPSSIRSGEIEKFTRDASRWWDENGPFAPLHALNPVRLGYIKRQICDHTGRDFKGRNALSGLSVLDIGCGGGIVCEPLARLGAKVTGIDADPAAIETAISHSTQSGLNISYQCLSPEKIPAKKEKYDVVLGLEVIEHTSDPAAFVATIAGLVKPGGIAILSTLNRTVKSYMLGIVAAEYVLGWVPRGTHEWKRFVRPSEMARFGRGAGLAVRGSAGIVFNPLEGAFALSSHDLDVNYLMCFTRPLEHGGKKAL